MALEVEERMEEKSKRSLKYKGFLILNKYIPHFAAILYIIYTILQIYNIDIPQFGCFTHVSLLTWTYMIITSIVFRYCYVHRLPLYYILVNEVLTEIDYYVGIPIEMDKLIAIHLSLIAFLILGYSLYYIKYKLK